MKTTARLLGAFQVVAGVNSLATLWSVMFARGPAALAMLTLLSALAIVAGVSMWREKPSRWQLTIINQLLQVIGIYSPWFSFTVIHGASITVLSRCFAKATFGDSIFNVTASATIGTSLCDVMSGKTLGGLPTYGVSLNLLALGILLYAIIARNKANRPSAPTPPSVTDRTGARSAPAGNVTHL